MLKPAALLLALLTIIASGCEDQQLKRAKADAEAWKVQAALWERTAKRMEAHAERAIVAAKQAQDIAVRCLEEKKGQAWQ